MAKMPRSQFNKFWIFLFLLLNAFMLYFYPHTLNENAQWATKMLAEVERQTSQMDRLNAHKMYVTGLGARGIAESAMRWGWAILDIFLALMIYLTRPKNR